MFGLLFVVQETVTIIRDREHDHNAGSTMLLGVVVMDLSCIAA
jgi:hypothetical protein